MLKWCIVCSFTHVSLQDQGGFFFSLVGPGNFELNHNSFLGILKGNKKNLDWKVNTRYWLNKKVKKKKKPLWWKIRLPVSFSLAIAIFFLKKSIFSKKKKNIFWGQWPLFLRKFGGLTGKMNVFPLLRFFKKAIFSERRGKIC